jgi:hypothetical protein
MNGPDDHSQMWGSAVISDMWDQLTFIGGSPIETSVSAAAARQMHELRPAFRRRFGSLQEKRATVAVKVATPGGDCFAQHDVATADQPGGPLRAAVWTEAAPAGNASAVCAHIVVINTALTATYAFIATLDWPEQQKQEQQLTAVRLFAAGPTLNVSSSGILGADFIAPGATNVYRIGCASEVQAAPVPNLANPLVAGLTNFRGVPSPGWPAVTVPEAGPDLFSHAVYDYRLCAS